MFWIVRLKCKSKFTYSLLNNQIKRSVALLEKSNKQKIQWNSGYIITVILALQKITNLALVYKWICREEMWGWAGTITGYQGLLALSSAPPTWDNIPLGYMDITFPHGCVLCMDEPARIGIPALQKSLFSPASSFSYIFIKVLPVQVPAQMPQRSIIIRCAANLLRCCFLSSTIHT